MKKLLAVLLAMFLVFTFVGAYTVSMVTDTGGLGDQSFNDGTWNGVLWAQEEFGVEGKVIQSREQADYIPNLSKAADESEVVIAVGFMMQDALQQVAAQFPDTKFIGIDFDLSGAGLPNVKTYTFKEHECAFLAGYLAGMMSETGQVGFVGGIKVPAVARFEVGYRAGVKMWNMVWDEDVEVLIGYTQTFTDAQMGKNLTEAQYSQGADIVFAAAGLCGLGTFEAAKSAGDGYFAIGVDVDQDHLAPGKILTSAMKGLAVSSFVGIADAYEGYFEPGHEELGLLEDGVGLSEMKYTKDIIPQFLLLEIEGLKAMAVDGELEIPATEEELAAFGE
ncbi:MAG TPA: BMP family ABC transporter substrate-binding protein [Thermotogota bacterium]|nr:BMP family ABC transporter substrate-binding protein [Thermotogota bacterium]HRW91872.1 BMP family ABC transporter substrate-binding protein [Thermotogota bacterium]